MTENLGFLANATIEDSKMPARTWSKFSDAMLKQAGTLLTNTLGTDKRITLAFPTIEERNEAMSLFRVAAKRNEGISASFREDRNEKGEFVLYVSGIKATTRKTDPNRPRKPKRNKGETNAAYLARITAYLTAITAYLPADKAEELAKITANIKAEQTELRAAVKADNEAKRAAKTK